MTRNMFSKFLEERLKGEDTLIRIPSLWSNMFKPCQSRIIALGYLVSWLHQWNNHPNQSELKAVRYVSLHLTQSNETSCRSLWSSGSHTASCKTGRYQVFGRSNSLSNSESRRNSEYDPTFSWLAHFSSENYPAVAI